MPPVESPDKFGYMPGGDGGFLFFSGGAGLRTAILFTKILQDSCKNAVPIRAAIHEGIVLLEPHLPAVGPGVSGAERILADSAAGTIAIDKHLGDDVSEGDLQSMGWSIVESPKTSNCVILTSP